MSLGVFKYDKTSEVFVIIGNMRVLMLSRDEKIFEKGSAVRARMVEYGTLFEELHIVVLNQISKIKNKNDIVKIKNVTMYPTNSKTKLVSFWKAYTVCKSILNLKSEILNLKWVVTSQDPFETGYIASKIAKKFSIPLQLQIHTDFLSPYFRKESIKNFVRSIVSRAVIKKADCIRVVSEKIKNSLNAKRYTLNAEPIVLPIFVDAEKIKAAKPQVLPRTYDFTVLWVGRLEKEKNPLLALEAFLIFQKHVPNSGLIIVGEGSERKKLELYAKRYTLNAHFIGWQNDIAGYYKSADVLLVTSNYEGYGLNMVEARIAGTPVIAPDVGVAREVGAYITDHTAEGIARMLARPHDGSLSKPTEYEYPYKDKSEYLELYKKSFEQCLPKDKKIL